MAAYQSGSVTKKGLVGGPSSASRESSPNIEFHPAHSDPRLSNLPIQSEPPRQTIALIDLAVPCSSRVGTEQVAHRSRIDLALRRLDGLTLLEWCVRRLSESTMLDRIIVTGAQNQRERIAQASLCDARWVPSPYKTPTERALEIAERFNAEWVVFASPLCPFTDPILLDRLIAKAWSNKEADFVGFLSPNNPSFSMHSLGLVGEMCSAKALCKLRQEKVESDADDVPALIRCHPELFTSKFVPLPDELNCDKLRFNLETVEDWDRAVTLLETAGDDFCWRRLARAADQLAHI